MPATYDAIKTETLVSAQGTIDFTSIPSTYTDLVFVASGRLTSGSATCSLRINGDSNQNYSQQNMAAGGSGPNYGASTNNSQTYFRMGEVYVGLTSTGWTEIIHINSYTSNKFKTVIIRNSDLAGETAQYVGVYESTSAISSLSFTGLGGNTFQAGSSFTLYGIKAA